jgi:DNA-binding FadR family transcriptional regulator
MSPSRSSSLLPDVAEGQLRGDQVYEALLTMLDQHPLERDTRLPGELELARRFEVSRPVLRQALARLRAEGRIYSRKGSGHYVGERSRPDAPSLNFGALTSVPDVQALLEFRLTIESECAARAALRRAPGERQEIRSRRRQYERAIGAGGLGIDEDIAFHLAIARASHNRFLTMTLVAIGEEARFGIRLVRSLSARPSASRLAEVCREHAAIEDAIAAGDAGAARTAMTAHLSRGIHRLFGR